MVQLSRCSARDCKSPIKWGTVPVGGSSLGGPRTSASSSVKISGTCCPAPSESS